MPSKKEYDLVSDDGYDSRIPLHNDDAFQHGIHFQAKYIGTLDVPRPSSRVEIVAAMRRIRYEFKAKAIKKKKVDLTISVEGVRVSISKKKKKLPQWYDDNKLIIVHHPIYRIFYVSHDSQDLKIWSYIARDGPSNVFKCNVFKSYKKEQAMRIVRTIGQAFEVCHKLSMAQQMSAPPPPPEQIPDNQSTKSNDTDRNSQRSKDYEDKSMGKGEISSTGSKTRATPPSELGLRQQYLYQIAVSSPQVGVSAITPAVNSPDMLSDDDLLDPELPVTSRHQTQLLRQQLDHHQQQTQVAVAQVQLLKEQLAAETAARIESQARTHQLLVQNRDLLDHMNHILGRLHELELKSNGEKRAQLMLTQGNEGPDPTTPQCGPVFLPRTINRDSDGNVVSPDLCIEDGNKSLFDTDSPDSGHREMSSDSLALCLTQGEHHYWATTSRDDRVKYSFGFSSPVKYKQMSYEMTAVVNSNPFASSGDNLNDQEVLDFSNFEEKVKSLTMNEDEGECSRHDDAPKLRPPPEFRNCDSLRSSQISDDSNSDSDSDEDSVKDGIVNFTDSDYYSHTGSSTHMNCAMYGKAQFRDNRDMQPSALLLRPRLGYHCNSFVEDPPGYSEIVPTQRRQNSFSDEENTESYDDHLAMPPSPPPPPCRFEAQIAD